MFSSHLEILLFFFPQKVVVQVSLSAGGLSDLCSQAIFFIQLHYSNVTSISNTSVSSLQFFIFPSSGSHPPLLEISAFVCHTCNFSNSIERRLLIMCIIFRTVCNWQSFGMVGESNHCGGKAWKWIIPHTWVPVGVLLKWCGKMVW